MASQLFLDKHPARPSRAVDGSLIQVRWLLGLAAWILTVLGNASLSFTEPVLVWLGFLSLFNILLWLGVHSRTLPVRLPIWALIGDSILFGSLPYFAPAASPLLFLLGLFPTLVGALRFGPGIGMLVGVFLTLPYEALAISQLLPLPWRSFVPIPIPAQAGWISSELPILTLFVAVALVGYLAQREREAAVGDTAVELDQLRRGMAGAKLFYETTDNLSTTLNYVHVLDTMLEAGIGGMPAAREGDGPPIGLVLFFETNDSENHLQVMAWRHLDRGESRKRILGKAGVVAEALQSGETVTFTDISKDPELSTFASLRRCRAGVCFPLQSGLDLYGVVILATPAPRVPPESHLQLMRAFTNQAAIAFQNARLYSSLREERDHIIDAEAKARAKLARDLHDGPTQSVAALAMRLEYIGLLMDRDEAAAKKEFAQAHDSAVHIGKELRELLFTLRPLTLETQGLSATMKLWCQRLRENESVPVDAEVGAFGPELDPNIAGSVFSIVEEAVGNARKHGGGAPIHISLCRQEESLIATVQDEGPGFDVMAVEEHYDQRGSLGLVNMRERARLLDGHLSIDSSPGRGTRVMLVVPLSVPMPAS